MNCISLSATGQYEIDYQFPVQHCALPPFRNTAPVFCAAAISFITLLVLMQTATRHSNGSRLSERQYSLCSEKIDRVENILLNFRLISSLCEFLLGQSFLNRGSTLVTLYSICRVLIPSNGQVLLRCWSTYPWWLCPLHCRLFKFAHSHCHLFYVCAKQLQRSSQKLEMHKTGANIHGSDKVVQRKI